MDSDHDPDYLCFGCLLMGMVEDNYSEENPVDLEEAIPALTDLLACFIASYAHKSDRKAATADVVRWLKDGVKQADAPVKMASGVVH